MTAYVIAIKKEEQGKNQEYFYNPDGYDEDSTWLPYNYEEGCPPLCTLMTLQDLKSALFWLQELKLKIAIRSYRMKPTGLWFVGKTTKEVLEEIKNIK